MNLQTYPQLPQARAVQNCVNRVAISLLKKNRVLNPQVGMAESG